MMEGIGHGRPKVSMIDRSAKDGGRGKIEFIRNPIDFRARYGAC